jgi:hypothetical protein
MGIRSGVDFGAALVWGTPTVHALRRIAKRGSRLSALYRTSATRKLISVGELLDLFRMTSVRRVGGKE